MPICKKILISAVGRTNTELVDTALAAARSFWPNADSHDIHIVPFEAYQNGDIFNASISVENTKGQRDSN